MSKKKLNYTEKEEPDIYYENDFVVDEIIENGAWLIDLEDTSWIKKRWAFQLKDFGEKEKENFPLLKKNRKIKIIIKTI